MSDIETKVIIYKQENGIIAVMTPANCGLTIEQIALKDVPTGIPFKIVDRSELPTEPQEAWEIDDSEFNDGVGA